MVDDSYTLQYGKKYDCGFKIATLKGRLIQFLSLLFVANAIGLPASIWLLLRGLVSDKLEFGFVVINSALVLAGYLCLFLIIARKSGWSPAVFLFCLLLEAANGLGHIPFSIAAGHYLPGLYTAASLLVTAIVFLLSYLRDKIEFNQPVTDFI